MDTRNSVQLIHADDTSLNSWRRDDLPSAVAIFSQETHDADFHRLANLALVRARLEQWESAERDARASIAIRPTILAYIAVSIALGGQGQLAAAKQEFNQVFLCPEPKNACLLLLIKAIIIFVAGDRNEATRRVGDMVQACEQADQPLCRAVQAQMQFLVGQTALDERDSKKALSLFASAGDSAPVSKLPELDTISLVFGWNFDSLLLVIRQQTCEALYMASRMSEVAESLQILVDEFGAEMKASAKLSNWLEDFSRRCAKASQGAVIDNREHHEDAVGALSVHPTLLSNNDSADSFFHVSTTIISLAKDSRKTINSIKLRKNNELLRDVQKTINAGGVHREEFHPPLVLGHEVHFSVLVSYSVWNRVTELSIDINPRDMECIRDTEGVRSYRKNARNVGVVVTGQHLFLPTTIQIIQSCPRFRLLIIGDSGVGKSSLLEKVFGVEGIHTSGTQRGIAEINREFIFLKNARLVVHDSLGFESGDDRNMEIVKDFVARRKAMPHLKDQLHAIWLCLETPYAGGRLLHGGVEEFLERRQEILGQIPLVVVLTKVDQLNMELEVNPPANEDVEQYKSRYLNKHCIGPLHKAAGSDVTHVTVSVQDGYSESLSKLVKATNENMVEYHVDEAPRVVASIAQRISIKEKIELSIAVGKKKYWTILLRSTVSRGSTFEQYLQVIRQDVTIVWNFNDPDQCLMDDNIIGAVLRTDNLGNSEVSPTAASFASLLGSAVELPRDVLWRAAGPIVGMAASVVQTAYTSYQKAKKDVKILMAYIVDLVCVMQVVFLLTLGGRVTITTETVALALRAYERPRRIVHLMVDAFDGIGRDSVMNKVEELIGRYSVADHEVEELRRKFGQVLPSSSS